jgi:hypothetical protein
MPQIDKVTFGTAVITTYYLYVYQYLFLNTTYLFVFFNTVKLKIRRFVAIYMAMYLNLFSTRLILAFPWVQNKF